MSKRKSLTAVMALVAILMLGALSATSASAALPEFRPATVNKFTGTGGGFTIVDDLGTYSCNLTSVTGEIVSAKEVSKVVLTFSTKGGSIYCPTFCENGSETWATKELKGRIGYINAAERRVGLLLEPTTQPFATCTRFLYEGKIKGSIIGHIEPTDRAATSFPLSFSRSGAKQTLQHFEGEELMHHLERETNGGVSDGQVALEGGTTLTMSKEVEIEA